MPHASCEGLPRKSGPPMNRFIGDCHHCRYVHRASQPSRGKCLACPTGRSGERPEALAVPAGELGEVLLMASGARAIRPGLPPRAGQPSASSCTCTAASSAEAAPPSIPTSRATRSASVSGCDPSSSATSRRPAARGRRRSAGRPPPRRPRHRGPAPALPPRATGPATRPPAPRPAWCRIPRPPTTGPAAGSRCPGGHRRVLRRACPMRPACRHLQDHFRQYRMTGRTCRRRACRILALLSWSAGLPPPGTG